MTGGSGKSDSAIDPLAGLRLSPESVPPMQAVPAKSSRHAGKLQFVRVPIVWMERLTGARYAATLKLAHYILFQDWKNGGEAIPLTNKALQQIDVSRGQKWRGLGELEALGLVVVDRR